MIYGILTSFLLPVFFYKKLSHYFMMKKESTENEKNLKKAFDDSKNVNEMNKVLRNIFSFENFVWISN
jgi:hypothetical protein